MSETIEGSFSSMLKGKTKGVPEFSLAKRVLGLPNTLWQVSHGKWLPLTNIGNRKKASWRTYEESV
jgi:hypothetical protein